MSEAQAHAATRTPERVVGIRFHKIGKLYHFDASSFPEVRPGDYVVVETARGRQMGQVMGLVEPNQDVRDYKPILRLADPRDLLTKQLWESKQVEALIICREKAAQMSEYEGVKFVAAEYNYDGSLLTFSHSSEDRVGNINKLKAALQRSFKSRVEMRQVGPRDVAKLIGGYGACSGPRCCSTFLTDFSPISIKMAKEQGISLSPSEITGMCGRLRCCLIYEYEQYVEARRELPKRNKRVGTPAGEGKVIDVHPLSDSVTVLIEDMRHTFKREQLEPLDELDALQKKAAAGCSKHEGGGCDCGAHRH